MCIRNQKLQKTIKIGDGETSYDSVMSSMQTFFHFHIEKFKNFKAIPIHFKWNTIALKQIPDIFSILYIIMFNYNKEISISYLEFKFSFYQLWLSSSRNCVVLSVIFILEYSRRTRHIISKHKLYIHKILEVQHISRIKMATVAVCT